MQIHSRRSWTRVAGFGDSHGWFDGPTDDALALIDEHFASHRGSKVFIHGGDTGDFDYASRHNPEHPRSAADEWRLVSAGLEKIRRSLPRRCRRVLLMGNHDDNPGEEGRIPREHRDLLLFSPENVPELRHWEITPYRNSERGVFRVGQIAFVHGYATGESGLRRQCVRFCRPGGLLVYHHDHRPRGPEQLRLSASGPTVPYWMANPGTMGTLFPRYMARRDGDEWGHGALLAECDPSAGGSWSRAWDARVERIESPERATMMKETA